MICISEFNIGIIPQLLLYFIPGYIALATYRGITSTVVKHEHDIWISCVVSYVLLAVTRIVLPASAETSLEWVSVVTCILAVIFAAIAVKVFQSPGVRKWLSNVLHFSPTPSVISDFVDLQYPGSTARIYLKGLKYYVVGAVASFSNNPEDPYIALQWYRLYHQDDETAFYQCTEERRFFIVNLADIQHIEIWPTDPEDE